MTKQTKIILSIIIICIVGWIVVGQHKTNQTDKTQTITIGMISMLSGEYSVVGENFRNGAILAIEQYNATHPNRKINLIIEDDGFDSAKALSAYQKLTSINHIDGLISVSTPSIGGIYNLVTQTDMPVVQGGEQPVQPSKDNVFQIMPGNIEMEKQLGAYLKEKGFKNPVIVYTNHDTMIRFKDAVVEGFGEPIKEFAINADEKDFKTHVLKASESNPDVLIIVMFPETGARFVKQYSVSREKLPQLAFDANMQSGILDYKRILGNDTLLNGSIVAIIASDISKEFKDAYKVRFGTEPGFWTDLGYDGVNLLVDTYDTDGKKWINNVRGADVSGVSGKIEFDDVGVRKPTVKMTTIEGGQIVISK